MVFQTAPPHPASKARMTCPPVLVGGPEASQNGLGLVTPANFTLRSAIFYLAGPRGEPSQASRPRAAAMPSATASTTSFPPFVQSPPAKNFRWPVWCCWLILTVPFGLISPPGIALRKSVAGFCPTARTTISTSSVNSVPGTGTGLGPPLLVGGPGGVFAP